MYTKHYYILRKTLFLGFKINWKKIAMKGQGEITSSSTTLQSMAWTHTSLLPVATGNDGGNLFKPGFYFYTSKKWGAFRFCLL